MAIPSAGLVEFLREEEMTKGFLTWLPYHICSRKPLDLGDSSAEPFSASSQFIIFSPPLANLASTG